MIFEESCATEDYRVMRQF